MACYSLKPINNFWKLDKIDKIIISIILVFFAIFSIFDCFCFASETDFDLTNYSKVELIKYSTGYGFISGTYSQTNYVNTYRIPINSGYNYIVLSLTTSGSGGHYAYALSNIEDLELGSQVDNYSYIKGVSGQSVVSIYNSGDFKYLYISAYIDNSISVYTSSNCMSAVVSDMVDFVGIEQLWSIFETSIPYIYIVLIVAIGIYFIFHAIREMSKGRDI